MQLTVSPWHPAPALIEDRVTVPDDPGQSYGSAAAAGFYFLGMSEQWRERITPDTALTYSAVWGCVRIIAQTLASIGWHVYERQERGARRLPIDDNISWTLGMQASPECSAFEWRQCMLKDALVWGNGYSEIERTNGGKVLWLWRLDPERVCPERDDAGRLYYRVRNREAGDTYLDPGSVFHLRGLGPDGIMGYSVVEMARRSIELGLQEERFGSEFFRRGPMPGGLLKTPGGLDEGPKQKLRESFERVYGGTKNAGRVVVLTGGMEFTPLSLPNNDSQFLESRTFQVSEIARWYGVPPHKLADLSRATFSNIEEQERAFVADCLLPWARRLESEADIKLYGSVSMGRRYTRMNLDALQRGNSATQTDTITKKVTGGLMTPNEGRAFFDLNPDPAGDVLMVQGQMMPLERAIEEPAPQPAGGATGPFGPVEAVLPNLAACGGPGSGVPGPCPSKEEDDGGDKDSGLHKDAKSANNWGKENVEEKAPKTAEEKKAVESYRRKGYESINGTLRGNLDKPLSESQKAAAQKEIGHLDAVMNKSSTKSAVTVARGLNMDPDKAEKLLKPGSYLKDNGFMSTTLAKGVADRFSSIKSGSEERKTVLKIEVPKGTRATYVGTRGEAELLLDRGTRLRVTGAKRETTKRGGVTVHRLTISAVVHSQSGAGGAVSALLKLQRFSAEADTGEPEAEYMPRFESAEGDFEITDSPDDEPPEDMPEDLRRPILALLEDAYGRLLRVEADKARRAANAGQLQRWAAGYYDEASEARVAAQLAPIVGAAAASAGKSAAWSAALARRLAADHNAAGRADPSSLGNGRGAAQAARHLDLIWEELHHA